jgi:hypothetical protein
MARMEKSKVKTMRKGTLINCIKCGHLHFTTSNCEVIKKYHKGGTK